MRADDLKFLDPVYLARVFSTEIPRGSEHHPTPPFADACIPSAPALCKDVKCVRWNAIWKIMDTALCSVFNMLRRVRSHPALHEHAREYTEQSDANNQISEAEAYVLYAVCSIYLAFLTKHV